MYGVDRLGVILCIGTRVIQWFRLFWIDRSFLCFFSLTPQLTAKAQAPLLLFPGAVSVGMPCKCNPLNYQRTRNDVHTEIADCRALPDQPTPICLRGFKFLGRTTRLNSSSARGAA